VQVQPPSHCSETSRQGIGAVIFRSLEIGSVSYGKDEINVACIDIGDAIRVA
jgi:hypothetical protein